MMLYLLAGLLPAIFLVGIGQAFRPAPGEPDSHPDWAGFLGVSWGLLLAAALTAHLLAGDAASWVALLLLPCMCALLAEGLLLAAANSGMLFRRLNPRHMRGAGVILLLDLLLLAALASQGDAFIAQAALLGGLILALVWLVWDKLSKWVVLLSVAQILLLLYSLWATDTGSRLFETPAWLAGFEKIAATLIPGLAVIALARLLGSVIAEPARPSRGKLLLAGALAVPILLLMGAQAATASAWDVATDGLGGIWALGVNTVFAIAAAILLAWRLPVPRRTPAFVFAMLIALFISGANLYGTFGFDGAWGNLPRARTERRAEALNRAILRYHERQGDFPQSLSELAPGYLLYLPTPFIIPEQDWCYQGGGQSYRLGYVYREYFSTPASVKVIASAGDPMDAAWDCEAEAAKYLVP